MCHEKYGWANHFTWTCYLWLSECDLSALISDSKGVARNLEESLKELVESENPLSTSANLYSDLLTSAIEEINFREIAEALLES